MRAKRFAQVSASDSEDGDASPRTEKPMDCEKNRRKRKRNDKKLPEEKEKEKEKEKEEGEEEEEEEEKEKEEGELDDPKPLGEPISFSGEGKKERSHYNAFEFAGNRYSLEDSVYITPETTDRKPDIAIIKDITQTLDGGVIVTLQWFYRPEEVEKKDSGSWPINDTRELFYSRHREELPAETVMHKCVVHFVPVGRQLPDWRKHPGYVVQHVYEVGEQQLWKILDNDHK